MGVHSRPNMWHLWHSVIGRGRPEIILKQAYKQRFLGILPSYQSRYFPLLHAVDYWWYGATMCVYCQQEMSSLHNSSIFRYINITLQDAHCNSFVFSTGMGGASWHAR